MALAFVFSLLAQRVPCVGDYLDEETLNRMRQREVYLQEQMTKLLLEIEEMEVARSRMGMQALLFALLPYWKIFNFLCLFILLFWFMWKIHREFQRVEDSSDEESSSSEEEQQQEQQEEQQEQQEEQQQQEEGVEEEQPFFLPGALWSIQSPQVNTEHTLLLLSELIAISQYLVSDTFYPVPQHPIGVGGAYEGWYPVEHEPVLCVLVPLLAPRGHVFHPDLSTIGELPAKNSRIHVALECTCGREQEMGMQCFLHASAEELRNQQPSLLHNLCTDSCLDVEKTARWFLVLIRNAWKCIPASATCSMNVVLSRRSCRLRVRNIFRSTSIKLVFGVQQDNTDIFLSSQETDYQEPGGTPSTIWPQSCAVAEAKFFQHVASHAEDDHFHFRCMQVCAYILSGHNFSTYELKTVFMHLLNAIPLENWHERYFLLQMDDIFRYLRCCVEEKRLNHFLIGNEDVPAEIILPQDFRESEPLNLFQHLAQDPDKHEQALQELERLEDRLTSMLIYGK